MTDTVKRKWHAVDIVVDPAACEAVEFAFNELGALGTEIDSLKKLSTEPLCVTGFFDDPLEETEIRAGVAESFRIHGLGSEALVSIDTRSVEETDWLAEWKKHWQPQAVGRFLIAPPWSPIEGSAQIVIRIEPNMAFGTGTHETTQLCLDEISRSYSPDRSLLDVGTGTGILAIAAAKLGGSSIFACDVDADSVQIARENARLNGVGDRIVFAEGPIDKHTQRHNYVCANLTLDVIEPMLPLLVAKTGAVLLLSGILAEQEAAAVRALRNLIVKDPEINRSGEWISITVRV